MLPLLLLMYLFDCLPYCCNQYFGYVWVIIVTGTNSCVEYAFIRILVKEECLQSGIVCTPDNRSILPRTFRHIRQTSRGVVRVVMWLQSIITLVANVYQGIQHYNRKTMLVRFSPKTGSRRLCCNTLLISIHLESMSRRRCIRMMNTLHVSFLSWNCSGRVWFELAHQNVKASRCVNVLKGK